MGQIVNKLAKQMYINFQWVNFNNRIHDIREFNNILENKFPILKFNLKLKKKLIKISKFAILYSHFLGNHKNFRVHQWVLSLNIHRLEQDFHIFQE